jgi:exopolysaccharide biosynthesis WecB/TagA/CpsF family protein
MEAVAVVSVKEKVADVSQGCQMKVNVGGVFVDDLTLQDWIDYFYSSFDNGFNFDTPKFFTSLNGNSLSKIGLDIKLKKIVDTADGVDPDGMSIVFGSRLFSTSSLPERVVTTDFAMGVFAAAANRDLRVYLLGGTERENSKALNILANAYPNINFAGRNGYFTVSEEAEINAEISNFTPHLLFIGLGVPKEQYFVDRNREQIKAGWIKTCGGMFKVFCGEVDRPPLWVQKIGFEWFYRCLREPKHVLWRYITTNPHSIYMMVKNSRFIKGN